MQIVIDIPTEIYEASQILDVKYEDTIQIPLEVIANGTPLQEMLDRENSEIKNEVKDLSERIENIEKQMKEDKEEQLKKIEEELNYAKFYLDLADQKSFINKLQPNMQLKIKPLLIEVDNKSIDPDKELEEKDGS